MYGHANGLNMILSLRVSFSTLSTIVYVLLGPNFTKITAKVHFTDFFFIHSGTVCPVVGLVSMDYIVVRLPSSDETCTDFCIMADDYNDVTSAPALATIANTSTTEVCIRLAKRLPRLYFDDGCLCLENAFSRK